MDIIGHRGASYDAPENTVAAIKLAWEQKSDGAEIDIHLSKDGRVMVSHDGDTARVAGVKLQISKSTSEELRKIDVGSHKGSQFAGERMPFLEEVLATIPPKHYMLIEIKSSKEIVPVLKRVLIDSGKVSQVSIIGFDLDTITEFKKAMPKVPTYYLRSQAQTPYDGALIDSISQRKLDGLDLHYLGVTKEYAEQIHAAGQKLFVWTVDDSAEAKRLLACGIDGLTTNRPGRIRDSLAK